MKYNYQQKGALVAILIGPNAHFKIIDGKPGVVFRKQSFCKDFIEILIDLFYSTDPSLALVKSNKVRILNKGGSKPIIIIEFLNNPFIDELYKASQGFYKKRLPKPLKKYLNDIVLAFLVIDALHTWQVYDHQSSEFIENPEDGDFYLFPDSRNEKDHAYLSYLLSNIFFIDSSTEIYKSEFHGPRFIIKIPKKSIKLLFSAINERIPESILPGVLSQREFLLARGWSSSRSSTESTNKNEGNNDN